MRGLGQLLRYLKPYKFLIIGNIISNVMMALFTVISIPAIIPFLHILFNTTPSDIKTPPFDSSITGLVDWVKYNFTSYVHDVGREDALIAVCFSIVFIFFFKNFFQYLSAVFMAPLQNGVVKDLRADLYQKYLSLPLSYYSEERKGDLLSKMTIDVQEVENSILKMLITIVRDPLIMIGSLATMIFFSPELMAFVFLLLLFTVIIIGGLGKRLKRDSAYVQNRMGDMIANLEETLTGLKIVKGFGAESYRMEHFNTINKDYKHSLNRLLWRRDLASPLSEFLGISVVAVLLWFGAKRVFVEDLSAETFFAFLYAFFNIIAPSKSFSSAYFNIQKGLAAFGRIQEVLDTPSQVDNIQKDKTIAAFSQSIEINNLSFAYPGTTQEVLTNINLSIPKGKIIALVGASGSGKTTLVDLLCRFYEPTKGSILIDDQPINNYTLKDWRQKLGMVTQEPILFNDTIENNILFGAKEVEVSKVIEAAKIANAHEFITQFPEQYQYNIGDSGNKLSGGQKQRLTIARAILKNPSILVLDEATSALDAESEKLVQKALGSLMQNRTAILIAHRLSTIQKADMIIVMDKGRIIERGTHEELMAEQKNYYELVKMQDLSS